MMRCLFFIQSKIRIISFPIALIICCFFLNCSKDKTSLPSSLQKLTEQTNCTCNPFIDEYKLNENTIYIYSCGGPACDCIAIYYNAAGEEFQLATGQDIDFVRHIWFCKE